MSIVGVVVRAHVGSGLRYDRWKAEAGALPLLQARDEEHTLLSHRMEKMDNARKYSSLIHVILSILSH